LKITNETKVGIIAVTSLVLLVLGFNFLKGKKLWSNDIVIKAKYNNVQGLQNSNPVIINGMQVGSVYKINMDKNLREIDVELNITKDVNIPNNSVATIKTNPLGTPSIEILLGNSTAYLKNKDSIATASSEGMLGDILKKADPILASVKTALGSVDTLVDNFNSVLDPNAKQNIAAMLANLKMVTASMVASTASLNTLLNTQNGALAKTLNNASSVTGNFAGNNEKINSIVKNLDKTSEKFSNINLQKTLDTLDRAINELKQMVSGLNNPNGTLGKLVNDPTLYKNLASSGNKLNLLLDDVRMNPKRYINISLIGRKAKGEPLLVPMVDTLNSPYYVEKLP
jgi:phospholipid/cholesterol/gamma-HCH transport system substrate-binding protein